MRDLPERAQGLFSYFTRHRTAGNLLLMLMLVLGAVAIPNMRAQSLPDVVVNTVSVGVTWEGAGPEDVDRAIVQLLEPALQAVDGVAETHATAREGRASITLDFEPGWNMMQASDDVQAAVNAVTDLPEEAEVPTVRRGTWWDRVTDVVITGPVAPLQLGQFADEMVTRLFDAGITRTTIQGLAAPETLIEVPTVRLMEHDIAMSDIAAAIRAEVDAAPAGEVKGANARVRTGIERRSPEALAEIVLRRNRDGTTLTIGDVADIRVEGADRERAYYVNDEPAMAIRVERSAQGDAVAIQRQVESIAADMRASLPQGVTVELVRTRAEEISAQLRMLLTNGVEGLVLVLVLLFLFLNARTAIWVAMGIPASLLAAIAVMYVTGMTFNTMSLFGLIIVLGIVVDDAIVVGEYADQRARRLGESPTEAAENAARRMAMPVMAATLTTMLAFLALYAVGGRFGDMIRDVPFAVIAVLAASMVECFLILPGHMRHALTHAAQDHWYDWPNRIVNRGFRHVRDRLFRPLVGWIVTFRYVVLAGIVLALASQLALLVSGELPWRFFNAPEQNSVAGDFAMVEGASRADSLEMMAEMQRAVEEIGTEYEARYGRNPVRYVMAQVGGTAGWGLAGADNKEPDLLGGISVELIDADLRPYSSFAFVGDLQERVRQHPLAEIVSFRGARMGPGGDALDVQFYGAEVGVLKRASLALQNTLMRYPEISGLNDDLPYDKEELILDLTPQGEALGFDMAGLGQVLRARLNGIEAATYPDGRRSAAIRVELPESEQTADFLDHTYLRTGAGSYVPLADIVTVTRQTGFSTVQRENGLRVISVTGDISEDDPARAQDIMQTLESEILPAIAADLQVDWRLSGLKEQESEFLGDATTGLILCLTSIYLVLVWVFSSWTRPFVVMAVVPFGLIGAIWGHYIWDMPLSMFSVVGLLGLSGIIINDSIVLVSTIDEYAQTRGLRPAIIDAVADRLRPVFLTTATTVLGLAPLLYENSRQALMLKPTVITLAYGLGFGMVLVLLLVPALVAMQHDLMRPLRSLRRGLRSPLTRNPLRLAVLLVMIWFGITMVWPVLSGALPAGIAWLAPQLAPPTAGLILFVIGSALLVGGVYGATLPRLAGRES